LEAMAIDNECEIVLDLIENNKEITNIIVKKGYAYCQPETRWQVAELIRRIGGEDSKNILIDMITNDKDKYVQRRALLSLNEISEEDGKKYASTKLDDDDDILKKVSLRILEGKTSLR
jgi:HEAT repeat protein